MPGIEAKDLDIRIENNILTIRGERRFEKKVNEDNYLRVERAYGSFSRSFSLSNTVNPDGIKADYQNGVLSLTVPKREEAKPKQIKVNVGASAGNLNNSSHASHARSGGTASSASYANNPAVAAVGAN